MLILFLVFSTAFSWFYVPLSQKVDYEDGAPVPLYVDQINSVKTQFPKDYYSLPFCAPASGPQDVNENLGSVLEGSRIQTSPYQLFFKQNVSCVDLCGPQSYTKDQIEEFAQDIRDEYTVYWLVDDLPVATKSYNSADLEDDQAIFYKVGFQLGKHTETPKGGDVNNQYSYLHNHVHLLISYNQKNVVGVTIQAQSIQWKNADEIQKSLTEYGRCTKSKEENYQYQNVDAASRIYFTYDVTWLPSDIPWNQRWDLYLQRVFGSSSIQWISVIVSISVALTFAAFVAIILIRTLRRDLLKYSEMDQSALLSEGGWKLISGDVFSPPSHRFAFCVMFGSGVQVLAMSWFVMTGVILGFLSPAAHGRLLLAFIFFFVWMGILSGFSAATLYKLFEADQITPEMTKKLSLYTAMSLPGFMFAIFFILNIVQLINESTLAIPVFNVVVILGFWLIIATPLVYLGVNSGMKREKIKLPVSISGITSSIPDRKWYMEPWAHILGGGFFPFGAVFIQIFYLLNAIWFHQIYYLIGFIFVSFVVLSLLSCLVTIVLCYNQLIAEDHRWWWRAFLTPAAVGLYTFIASLLFVSKLGMTSFSSYIIYFGYSIMLSSLFGLMCGAIGFISCFIFVYKIYEATHVE